MAYVQKLIVLATAVCSAYAASTNGTVSLATNTKSNGNNLKDYNSCILTILLSGKCGDIPITGTSDREMCNGVYQLTDCIKSNYNRVTLGVCTASDRDDFDRNFDSIEVCKKVDDKCDGQTYTRRWCKDNGYNPLNPPKPPMPKLIVKTKHIALPIDFLKANAGFCDDHDDIYFKSTESLVGKSQPLECLVPIDANNLNLCENYIIEFHAKPYPSKNSELEVDPKCTCT
ncbi:unnamed protein product [Oppiella nova]|uniref:Uncharacterized protein n=1 Tax=Oppiella nova TaxID=334625 RepID=A0A7R9M5Z8_9ACAR|nr:unnamed protein product [Oppiella nova]CAG2171306.1 unnamed protein product [Oppiella nova]